MPGMNRNLKIAFVLLVSLGHSVSTLAVDFTSPVSYPVGMSPVGIAIADFNGDGKPDITVANSGSGNVSILLGNGDGTFQAAVNFDAGMASPSSVAVGDFNRDGKLDVVAFQPGNTNPANILPGAVAVLVGNGDGTFQTAKTLAMPSSAAAMLVADFNLDGKSDLAVMDLSIGVIVFLGNGDGTFQPAKQTSVPSGAPLRQGDFNGDGKPDLTVASGNSITLFLGSGDGTFQSGSTVEVADGFAIQDVRTGDINADGKVDLVVESETRSQFCRSGVCTTYPSSEHISLFLAGSSGSLLPEQIVASASSHVYSLQHITGSQLSVPALVGDFNGDGKLDLGYVETVFSSLSQLSKFMDIRLGKGDGMFSACLRVANSVAVALTIDLNNDKFSDLIRLDNANNAVVIELNTSPTSGADMGIIGAVTSAQTAGIGLNLAYTADVLNEGPREATGVKFTDTLPNEVSFVSASTTQGRCLQSHGIVTCDIGALASASEASVTIVVTPTATGTITNNMDVTAAEQDLVSTNNTATQSTTVVPIFSLTVAKAGSGSGTVTSSPSGIDCGGACSESYVSGSSILLAAVPSAGSQFSSWSGACTGTDPNSCAVTLNSNQTVTATFNIPPDFSVDPTAASLIVKRGGEVSEVLNFSAQGGFSGTIALTCSVSGPSPMPTCGVSPGSVTTGSTSTLTVNASVLLASFPTPWFEQGAKLYGAWIPLGLLGCLLATGLDRKRRRIWALCLLIMLATILPAACGGGSTPIKGPPPQNFTVTVTATSGKIQHSTNVMVTVQ